MKATHKPMDKLNEEFLACALPIIEGGAVRQTAEIRQHGGTTRYSHCVSVAYYSLKTANALRIPCNRESLVKGGLLHDYYFYDRRKKNISQFKNSFMHPKLALENAMRDFSLTPREQNIIVRHMFPITLVPPKHIEGLIVCVTDKLCGLAETFGINRIPIFESEELWGKQPDKTL